MEIIIENEVLKCTQWMQSIHIGHLFFPGIVTEHQVNLLLKVDLNVKIYVNILSYREQIEKLVVFKQHLEKSIFCHEFLSSAMAAPIF